MTTSMVKIERMTVRRSGVTIVWPLHSLGNHFNETQRRRLNVEHADAKLGARLWFVDLAVPGYRIYQEGGEVFKFSYTDDAPIEPKRFQLELHGSPVTPTKYRVCLPPEFHVYGLRYFGSAGYEMQVYAGAVAQFVNFTNVRTFQLEQDTDGPVMVQLAQPVTFIEVRPLQPEGLFCLGLYFRRVPEEKCDVRQR